VEGARLVSLLQKVHVHIVGKAIGGPWKRVEMMMRMAMEMIVMRVV
jgi:hypothetical protein